MGNALICAHVLTLAQLRDLSHYCYGMIKATQAPESVQKKEEKVVTKKKNNS